MAQRSRPLGARRAQRAGRPTAVPARRRAPRPL